ncbi:MAG: PA0069 family radical SAM protein [Pyruvatibacter sp.]
MNRTAHREIVEIGSGLGSGQGARAADPAPNPANETARAATMPVFPLTAPQSGQPQTRALMPGDADGEIRPAPGPVSRPDFGPGSSLPSPKTGRLHEARKGRGARSNRSGRYEHRAAEAFDDGWDIAEDEKPLRTHVSDEAARTIITRNQSPDISFDRSINPYRGCEHGCVYCFARPTHAYMGLSAGLDFESKLFAKPNAAKLLRRELSKPGYEPRTIAIGTNTDPYQPIERERRITRQVLEVLAEHKHPVGIVTKSAMVTRDIDILSEMARDGLVKVALSVTTLDGKLARAMEPRASTPGRRLDAIRQLSEAGIPTGVMVAPVIPALNDHEIEAILKAVARMGAREAGYVMLRLPLEIKDLFAEWLADVTPDRAKRVMKIVRDMRGGKDYDAEWGKRMTGGGPYAWTISRRFALAMERHGLSRQRLPLRTDLFEAPNAGPKQLALL